MGEVTNSVSYLEARAGFLTGNDLPIQAGGVEGQTQLLWNSLELQLHLGTDFLSPTKKNNNSKEQINNAVPPKGLE